MELRCRELNILFLTLIDIKNIDEHGIYQDLMREFVKNNHQVYIVSPSERCKKEETRLIYNKDCNILKVKIGNIQKTNLIEKGISTLQIETQFKAVIIKYFSNVKFDLILYSTPPITFAKVISYIKYRDGAQSYLLLKDIFPQNAVDLGMFSKKNPIYTFFRMKEKKLYALSDYIGCMSLANVDYVLQHNPGIDPGIIHVSPNTIEIIDKVTDRSRSMELRGKYGIPLNCTVFVYGGNLGKPQGIPFLIDCLKANAGRNDRFFVICGTGTEYLKLEKYIDVEKPKHVLLIAGLPKDEYEDFIKACDVGLIFLDHRFTIPNFPSRLLSYMQNQMPVLACTDPNTDVGTVITKGGFGWWCESNSVEEFTHMVDEACRADLVGMGEMGYEYLKENYTVERSYEVMMEKLR
ncbi:MAG: glycosyltransferase family 4 protein [Lachnospiraceae bacterium]